MKHFTSIAPIGKAVTGAIVALLTALLTGAGDGSISLYEGLAAAVAFFVGLGAVWYVPNRVESVDANS